MISSLLFVIKNRMKKLNHFFNHYLSLFLLLIFCHHLHAHEPIDVVIPCHKKDLATLNFSIQGIKKYGKNINRVIVISADQLTGEAEWFSESKYPFNKLDIALEIFNYDFQKATEFINSPKSRIGWIHQQFLKLYAPLVIPSISSNVLVLDADTIFLNPVEFIDDTNTALYNFSTEHHAPYFTHAQKLIPGFFKVYRNCSGICHHMILQRSILNDLLETIKNSHNVDPWRAICRCIDYQESSCFSEYELYFNFIFSRNYAVKLRKLNYQDMKFDIHNLAKLKKANYHYASCHTWITGKCRQ